MLCKEFVLFIRSNFVPISFLAALNPDLVKKEESDKL